MNEDDSTMEIYLSRAGKVNGPYTLREAKGRLARGEFGAGDQVWSQGQSEWVPVESHSLLQGYCGLAKNVAPPAAGAESRKSWFLISVLTGTGVFGLSLLLVVGLLLTSGEEAGVPLGEESRDYSPEEAAADLIRSYIGSSPPAVQQRQVQVRCNACQGSGQSRGQTRCFGCAGRGVITTPSGHTTVCTRCSGAGFPPSPCVICRGTGSRQSDGWNFGYR